MGIGAFVYPRRIFEWAIEEAHKVASAKQGWDEAAYNTLRMSDKISMLHDHLPSFLVEHKSQYSILSKGIHELTEGACKSAFADVRLGIELILDDILAAHDKAE